MIPEKLKKRVNLRIESMAAMLLLVVLAALTMLLISSTGRTYRGIVRNGGQAQEIRTSLLFVATKVRQAESGACVTVRSAPWGGSAVVIAQHTGGSVYEDWIFAYDGSLREILIPVGTAISPQACSPVAAVGSFTPILTGGRLDLQAAASGDTPRQESLTLALRF